MSAIVPLARSRPAAAGRLLRLRSDATLAERFAAGDEAAFSALYERHRASVLSVCMGVLGSRHDAEDAAQEAFASLAVTLRQTPPREIRAWLVRVARNAAIDLARRRRLRAVGDGSEATDGAVVEAVAADAGIRSELESVLAGIRELPESQRTALLMRELGGHTYEEIAALLETDEGAVRGLIARARIGLREHRAAIELSCASARASLETEPDGRRRDKIVRRHLRRCTSCQAYRKALRSDARALRGLSPLPFGGLASGGTAMGLAAKGALTAGTLSQVGAACAVSLCSMGGVVLLSPHHFGLGHTASGVGSGRAAHGRHGAGAGSGTAGAIGEAARGLGLGVSAGGVLGVAADDDDGLVGPLSWPGSVSTTTAGRRDLVTLSGPGRHTGGARWVIDRRAGGTGRGGGDQRTVASSTPVTVGGSTAGGRGGSAEGGHGGSTEGGRGWQGTGSSSDTGGRAGAQGGDGRGQSGAGGDSGHGDGSGDSGGSGRAATGDGGVGSDRSAAAAGDIRQQDANQSGGGDGSGVHGNTDGSESSSGSGSGSGDGRGSSSSTAGSGRRSSGSGSTGTNGGGSGSSAGWGSAEAYGGGSGSTAADGGGSNGVSSHAVPGGGSSSGGGGSGDTSASGNTGSGSGGSQASGSGNGQHGGNVVGAVTQAVTGWLGVSGS